MTPSTTEQRWPGMSVATAGTPQAAPSVSVRPQPSASDADATSHARRYSSRRPRTPDVAGQLDPAGGVVVGHPRARARRRCGPSPTIRSRRSGTRRACRGAGLEQDEEPLDRRQASGGDDERAGDRAAAGSGAGAKNASTPLSTAVTRAGPEAEADQLLTGRLGRGHDLGAAVPRRRQAGLEEAAGAGERRAA